MLISTACVAKSFNLPSSFTFPTWKMDHGIDLANIRSLVSSIFFIMTKRASAILPHMSQIKG